MSNDRPQAADPAARFETVLGLAWCLSTPLRRFCTVPGTAGPREVGGVSALVGLGLMLLWGGLTGSEALVWLGVPLALLTQAWHRLAGLAAHAGHSRDIGDSAFAGLVGGDQRKARYLESAAAVVLGWAWAAADPGGGAWLAAAGAGHGLSVWFLCERERQEDQDLLDLRVEQARRADRLKNRTDHDPGGATMGLKERLGEYARKQWQMSVADAKAYGRYGLKDLQALVLAEYAGPTPSEPGTLASPTSQEVTEQRDLDRAYEDHLSGYSRAAPDPGREQELDR